MKRCIIFGAAPVRDTSVVPVEAKEGDLILCADGGYAYARALGLVPDVLLGDFDSLAGPWDLVGEMKRFPPEKDDTDLMLSVKEGLARGYRDFAIYGALGGRLDHTIASIQTLAYLTSQGAKGVLYGEGTQVYLLKDGALSLPRVEGAALSVFAYGGNASGVTLRGTKYPLEDGVLQACFPLGVSNEFAADVAEITVKKGSLLILTVTV